MECTLQGKREDDTSSIQLGIYVPKQTANKERTKMSKTGSTSVLDSDKERTSTNKDTSGKRRKRAKVGVEEVGKRARVEVDEQRESAMVDVEQVLPPNNHEHEQIKSTDATQKKRWKRKHRRKDKESTNESGKMSANRDSALQYLHTWHRDPGSWSFKKKTQYWLLKSMYDKSQVSQCVLCDIQSETIILTQIPVFCIICHNGSV